MVGIWLVIVMHSVLINVSNMKKLFTSRGFTLLELIIVIGVLAILSLLVLMVVNPLEQFRKANDARRKDDLSQIQRGLEQYYQDNGAYPTGYQANVGGQVVSEITNPQLTPIPWGGSWSPYMNVIPNDPSSNRTYVYVSTGQKYWLYTSLERGGKDVQACKSTDNSCQIDPFSSSCQCGNVPVNVYCGGTNVCTYGVSSPNTTP